MKKIALIFLAFFCLLSCEKMDGDSNVLVGNKDGSVKCTDKKGSIKEYTYSYDKENQILTIGSDKITVKELTKSYIVTVNEINFVDGTVKPAGMGVTYYYNYWQKNN